MRPPAQTGIVKAETATNMAIIGMAGRVTRAIFILFSSINRLVVLNNVYHEGCGRKRRKLVMLCRLRVFAEAVPNTDRHE